MSWRWSRHCHTIKRVQGLHCTDALPPCVGALQGPMYICIGQEKRTTVGMPTWVVISTLVFVRLSWMSTRSGSDCPMRSHNSNVGSRVVVIALSLKVDLVLVCKQGIARLLEENSTHCSNVVSRRL